MEDDNASNSSDDSLALLPDLQPIAQNLNGPDVRAGRAHSALRRNHPGNGADKTPSGISYVDLCFHNDKEHNHKNSGKKLRSLTFIVSVLQLYFCLLVHC